MDEFQELETLLDEFGIQSSESKRSSTHETITVEQDDVALWNDETDEPQHEYVDIVNDFIQDSGDRPATDDMEGGQSNIPTETVCSCPTPCLDQFSRDGIERHVLSLREMEKTEKEMFILGSLQKIGSEETRNGKRRRVRYRFMFDGQRVCKTIFCMINDIGKDTLKALQLHMNVQGTVPRVHGNVGRKPYNALRYEDVKACVDFLLSYGDLHGLPMPSVSKGRNESPPLLLPTHMTKISIHKHYVESCEEPSIRALGITSFKDVWKHCVPHIKIMSPTDDVCCRCELTRKKVADAVTEADKLAAAKELQEHIQDAQTERAAYKSSVAAGIKEVEGYVRPAGPVPPSSTDFSAVHYTFDYSQNVALPQHSQQMGPLYFRTRRKVQIFGIRNDSLARQYNYLIDEDQSIGADGTGTHGPNTVISMLHHCLFRYSLGEKGCVMHADNCGGQNKNRYMLAYLSWRIHQGLNDNIMLMMQIPGHTKCLVDAGFGHIKKLFRRTDCETLHQLVKIVQKSSHNNVPITFKNEDDEQTWIWYDWKTFLEGYFIPLVGIRKFHHFRFTHSDKEAVYVKERAGGAETRVILVKRGVTVPADEHPLVLPPGGLSRARQEYLYKHIRPFIRPEFQNITCPGLMEE